MQISHILEPLGFELDFPSNALHCLSSSGNFASLSFVARDRRAVPFGICTLSS